MPKFNIINPEEDQYFEELSSEEQDKYTEPDSSYKISSYGADFTVSVLFDKIKNRELVIPDFQRRYVWDKQRASRLIESFLLNIPVPSIFVFREPDTQKLLVVDGNQRLKTIEFFLGGKFCDGKDFSLIGVQPKWIGKTFKTLNSRDQIKLKDSILRTVIFEQKDVTDNRSMYQIFERLNTETSPLLQQEIRNALYRGPFNELLKKLNEDPTWRKLIGKATPLPRMRDVELILRFFALFYNLKQYSKPMKQFLNDFMNEHRNLSRDEANSFEHLFLKTMSTLYKALGQDAFKIRTGINVAFFDAISVGTAKTHPTLTRLKSAKGKLLASKSFNDAVEEHTTDKERIFGRIDQAVHELAKNK